MTQELKGYSTCNECDWTSFLVYENILICAKCGHPHRMEEFT